MFAIEKFKNALPCTYVISDFNCEKIIAMFYKKQLQKTNQKECKVKNVTKGKCDKLMLNGKATIILLTVRLMKKT